MSEATTDARVRKFPCESCGADIRWDPGANAMVCPYCGHVRTIAPSTTTVEEKPVDAALRAPRDLGWGAERKVIACSRCGAHTTIEPHVAATSCAFCGTSAVVEAPPNASIPRPEGVLPFRIGKDQAVNQFRGWLSGLWFRPNDLKSHSRLMNLQGVYVPFWTFDAATQSWWTADAGWYYYVTVQVEENGQQVTRQEQRVRWEPASGALDHFFDDVPVPASRGLEPALSRKIEPFPTDTLIAYEPSYLSGFLAEENAIDVDEALESAKTRMNAELYNLCSREVPGDTQRNLNVSTTFSALAYKNALLPIWIAAYDYHGTPYRYIVNGVTGQAAGTAPWSWIKITLAVMAAIVILVIFISLKHH